MTSTPDDIAGHGSLEFLRGTQELGALVGLPRDERLARGYGHTLEEIAQQPRVWPEVASRVARASGELEKRLAGSEAVVVTGSGSSLYASECIAPALHTRLGLPATAAPTGTILTHPEISLPPADAFLLVSVARSGNSPESRAAVDWVLEARPAARHVFISCNRNGALATSYDEVRRVFTLLLPEETNDESLVMTSSFTSLVLAGLGLGALDALDAYEARARALSRAAVDVLTRSSDPLASAARCGFGSALYLGSGYRLGAAREAALKMMEMNAGKVAAMAESFLGLRHGPMAGVQGDTLLVAFLSSEGVARAYEVDVLGELRRKGLGGRRVVVGTRVPPELAPGPGDVVVDIGAGDSLGDEQLGLIDVVVGQLLAFFRCLDSGFRPDSPSQHGIITRVVSEFEIHRRR
jgi:tagatose-6-phosphate ketose/aldose isomerase